MERRLQPPVSCNVVIASKNSQSRTDREPGNKKFVLHLVSSLDFAGGLCLCLCLCVCQTNFVFAFVVCLEPGNKKFVLHLSEPGCCRKRVTCNSICGFPASPTHDARPPSVFGNLHRFTPTSASYTTAVRLHVYLVFVKSIEQELKIQ